jgi:uncharacterized protein (TIRG00374 family)
MALEARSASPAAGEPWWQRARRFFRGWGKYLLHAAVLVGLAVAAGKYLDDEEFWRALRQFDWRYAPAILSLSVGYVLVKGWRFVTQLEAATPVDRSAVMKAYVAGQACTLLPGGATVRAGLLDQIGVPVSDSAASIALSSASDQVTLGLCALLAALWFEPARPAAEAILTVLILLSLVLGIEASRTWLLDVIERLMGKVRLLGFWNRFVESMKEVCSPPVLLGSLGNSIIAFALLLLALHFSVVGVGARIPFTTLLLAMALPTMLGRMSALPGGVGVTEAGMVSVLNSVPGVSLDQAAAAAVTFRVGSVFFAAAVGALVYVTLWRAVPKGSRAKEAASSG